jgi:TPR repeat protein
VKALLVAIAVIATGCNKKAAKAPPEDGGTGDGGIDLVELAGQADRACAHGDLEACRNLGVMYAGGTGVSPDTPRATKLFTQACDGGNLPACNNLATALAEGVGVERQPAKAAEVFRKACDGDYRLACHNLGLMLRDGRGVPADLARAAVLFDKACKGAVPFACTNAGDVDAMRARTAASHYKEMIAHYKAGCDAGDPTSCRQLGIAYLEGRGLPKSTSAAALWLERACMPDDPIACRVLGMMVLQGIGVARDPERGKQMLARACKAKDDEACRALKMVTEAADAITDAASAPDTAVDGGAPREIRDALAPPD